MQDLAEFYRGKRVFVTGHTGFKGSWLALWLAEMGADVHGYSLAPPTTPSLFEEGGIRSRLASHRIADVRDVETLTAAVRDARPDLVFHLAAQALVRESYRSPRETYETNVMGTVNLLEAVRAAMSVRVCVVVTSDKCYENREWVHPYRESDRMGGADPYSNSKGCAELVVAAYRRSFFPPERIDRHRLSLSTARAGNVIGGGDWATDRIVPDCIRALGEGRPIPVRNPRAVRPWQHVLEPLSGYLLLAARQWRDPAALSDAWNFGPTPFGNWTVRGVVEKVLDAWGSGSWEDLSAGTGPDGGSTGTLHEAHVLKLDITKSATLLGWHPAYDVPESVAQTVEWYRLRARDKDRFDASARCVEQIHRYPAPRTDFAAP